MFIYSLYFPRSYLFVGKWQISKDKSELLRKLVAEPKFYEGLSEDVIIAKNLRTPPGSEEDAKMRDNRMQEIRRLQSLRWYKYKYIIPRWEVLFALKNP